MKRFGYTTVGLQLILIAIWATCTGVAAGKTRDWNLNDGSIIRGEARYVKYLPDLDDYHITIYDQGGDRKKVLLSTFNKNDRALLKESILKYYEARSADQAVAAIKEKELRDLAYGKIEILEKKIRALESTSKKLTAELWSVKEDNGRLREGSSRLSTANKILTAENKKLKEISSSHAPARAVNMPGVATHADYGKWESMPESEGDPSTLSIVAFLTLAWGTGLFLYCAIPILIRYVILKRPLKRRLSAIGILLPLWVIYAVLDIVIGQRGRVSAAINVFIMIGYFILMGGKRKAASFPQTGKTIAS